MTFIMLIRHFLIQKVQLSVIECKGGGGSSSSNSQLLDLVICARSSALDNVKLLQVLYIPAPRSMLHSLVEITCWLLPSLRVCHAAAAGCC